MNPFKSKLFTAAFCMGVLYFAIWGITSLRKKPAPAAVAKPQLIERYERHGLYARGDNPRMAVDYIDRRNSEVEVYYNDEDSDGHIDQVTYFSDGKSRITFVVSRNERLTERANIERFENGRQFTMVEAPKVSFWVKSPEGQNLDATYGLLKLEYKKLHPEAKMPELEIKPEPARTTVIKNVGAWADELLARKSDNRRNRPGRQGEIDYYRYYLCEKYLAHAYEQLNDRERSAMYDWDYELSDTALEVGRKLAQVIMADDEKTWSRWPRNPQRLFEEWIHEPQEIDFMSAFSIAQEFDKQEATYKNELRRRGLSL